MPRNKSEKTPRHHTVRSSAATAWLVAWHRWHILRNISANTENNLFLSMTQAEQDYWGRVAGRELDPITREAYLNHQQKQRLLPPGWEWRRAVNKARHYVAHAPDAHGSARIEDSQIDRCVTGAWGIYERDHAPLPL